MPGNFYEYRWVNETFKAVNKFEHLLRHIKGRMCFPGHYKKALVSFKLYICVLVFSRTPRRMRWANKPARALKIG